MLNCLAVGVGGFVGAVLRYLVSMIPLDKTGSFPVNTLLINVLGAFAIGAITALGAKTAGLYPRLTLLLKTGICGGFTTFSTFALESVTLLQSGKSAAAVCYIVLSTLLSLGAVLLAEAAV